MATIAVIDAQEKLKLKQKMITQIKGKLVEKTPTQVVVDCNGIGYEINISLYTFSSLSSDENIKLFTHLQVREDAHILYGFFTVLERAVFRLLISVSGIGTSTARTMLSSLTPAEIQHAIGIEDVATIQGIKGIGLKTAQRVIIELKDKIKHFKEPKKFLILKAIQSKKKRYQH